MDIDLLICHQLVKRGHQNLLLTFRDGDLLARRLCQTRGGDIKVAQRLVITADDARVKPQPLKHILTIAHADLDDVASLGRG